MNLLSVKYFAGIRFLECANRTRRTEPLSCEVYYAISLILIRVLQILLKVDQNSKVKKPEHNGLIQLTN